MAHRTGATAAACLARDQPRARFREAQAALYGHQPTMEGFSTTRWYDEWFRGLGFRGPSIQILLASGRKDGKDLLPGNIGSLGLGYPLNALAE